MSNGIIVILLGIVSSNLSYKMVLELPGAITDKDDVYVCSAFKIPNNNTGMYITSYEATTDNTIAHHVLIIGCKLPFSTKPYYVCPQICENDDKENLVFLWARNASKFEYPFDVAMAVGGHTGIDYLVLQVHYLKKMTHEDRSGMILEISEFRPSNLVSILRLVGIDKSIPANTSHVNIDTSCRYNGKYSGYVIAFRVHAHSLGRSISGYRIANGRVDLIGKANPQWPQTFYKTPSKIVINRGDYLMSRCVYDSRGRDHVTILGPTHMDEMCNFYVMMVIKNKNDIIDFDECEGDHYKSLWKFVPSYSKKYSDSDSGLDNFLPRSDTKRFVVDKEWRVQYLLGEVSSVAILQKPSHQSMYSLLVLHHGNRYLDKESFKDNTYIGNKDPISSSTILDVDPTTGQVLRKGGMSMFFIPHSVTVTKDMKHVWVTDLALHQAMRFRLLSHGAKLINEKPDIVLGERFVHGNDRFHFCKPTKVVVDKQGFIFVADGFCNSRVVSFYPNGTYANEWSTKDTMTIVSSISIEEDSAGDISRNTVWVSGGEQSRIVGFTYDGSVKYISPLKQHRMPIAAIQFEPSNGLVYCVTSNGMTEGDSFIYDYKANMIRERWHKDYHMTSPSEICVTENASVIFVADLHSKRVVKFSIGE